MNKSGFSNFKKNDSYCKKNIYKDNCKTSIKCENDKCNCYKYIIGIPGPSSRPTGPTGATGSNGLLNYADFYALMPPDNAATVAPAADVNFPQDGPNSGSGISQISDSSFSLDEIGTYQILFQVSISEAGQLVLTLNGDELGYTVVGQATGTNQYIGIAIVTTTSINSIITVRNPPNNATALTITPNAGGTESVSAHLVILQIQ